MWASLKREQVSCWLIWTCRACVFFFSPCLWCFSFLPDVVMSKSTAVSATFDIGKSRFWTFQSSLSMHPQLTEKQVKVHLLENLSHWLPFLSFLYHQISASFFNGTPIASKAVYVLDGSQWPNKVMLNLHTNQNGLDAFSLTTANFPKANLNYLILFINSCKKPILFICSLGKCNFRGGL